MKHIEKMTRLVGTLGTKIEIKYDNKLIKKQRNKI